MAPIKYLATAAIGLALVGAAPASAVVVTFATFSALNTTKNFRLVNSGNSSAASRTTDATLFTTATGTSTVPGSVIVKFSFLQPQLNAFVNNANASFTYNATVARNTPATTFGGQLFQSGITGSFSFLSTTAITVSGPGFVTHTYAAGSNLLSGSFTNATLNGSGSSAGTTSSTASGSLVSFTSDFLDFSNTVQRDRGLTLTAITPSLSKHAGLNGALNAFRATAGGQFSSDPAPLINGLAIVPEPATWAMLVVGFGLVGVRTRRRSPAASVTA